MWLILINIIGNLYRNDLKIAFPRSVVCKEGLLIAFPRFYGKFLRWNLNIDSLFHDIYITWKRFALNGSRPKSSMVRCVVPLFRGFNLSGLLWYDTVLGLSLVWVFHNLVVHCSTWVFYLTRLLWNITTFMNRCFIPLLRGNYPIMDALIWEGIGLIPSVVLLQNGGPLFYVGVYPDRIALKYHYFYVCS